MTTARWMSSVSRVSASTVSPHASASSSWLGARPSCAVSASPVAEDDPEEELLTRERTDALVKAIAALPERLGIVVRGYFFEERTVGDLAEELGVTQSRISQLRAEAIELLRDGVNAQLDPAHVSPLRRVNGRLSRRKAAYRATMARQGTAVPTGCAAG